MEAAETVLKTCMNIKDKESLLIVTDDNKKDIGEYFLNEAVKLGLKAKMIKTAVGKENGAEPSKNVAAELKKCEAALLITEKSLSHTKARKDASSKGVRIASMPSITMDIIERAIPIDYEKMKEVSDRLKFFFKDFKKVKVKTKKGTDIEFGAQNRTVFEDTGIYHNRGDFGNLPAGELCFGPVEGTTNGIVVVDESMAGIGKLDGKLKLTVSSGFVTKLEGDKAKELIELLSKYGAPAFNIAELGIGINPKAKITGCTLEDEKVLGTAHVALGNNKSFGGVVDVPLHLDGVFSKPTIEVDGKRLMKQGKLLV